MADGDLIKLYSGRILELAAAIPLTERLDRPDATVKKRSPLCGSTVTVDLTVRDGVVAAFAQDVKACALGQAAAAIVGANILGRSQAEVLDAQAALRAMLREGGPVPPEPFTGFGVLEPARDYKNRHASIMLTLDAAADAFAEALARQTTP